MMEPAVRGQVWETDDVVGVIPAIQSYNSDVLKKTDKQDLKLYTVEQMQEFAIRFAAFTLSEGIPDVIIDLVFDEDYLEYASKLMNEFEENRKK